MSLQTQDTAATGNDLSGLSALLEQDIDVNKIVRAFAANRAFRAAERHELSTTANPFRRPVRPDDLEWLDYGKPLRACDARMLSALLGHRMLRNIYDGDLLYLAPTADPAVAEDSAAFYCTRNRTYSALAAPILERHVFSLLADVREPLPLTSLSGLIRHVREYCQRRLADPGQAFEVALSATHRDQAATFVTLQLSAYAPAAGLAVTSGLRGDYRQVHPGLLDLLREEHTAWTATPQWYQALLATADVSATPAAHWQMYLGSTLARGNYLHFLARNRHLVYRFLGAVLHKRADDAVTRSKFVEVAEEGLGLLPGSGRARFARTGPAQLESELADLITRVVGPLAGTFGPSVIDEVYTGFTDAAWLAGAWDRDLSEQLAWADDIPAYQDKAMRIDRYLTEANIQVDLDTFVESCEETSTTHVHDDHRLVMIESGMMHFWNNITHQIALNTGDKILIPMSRLHGSTVLSGECVYHQPIIPDDILNRVG